MVTTNSRYYNTREIIENLKKTSLTHYEEMLKCADFFDVDNENIKLDPIRLFNKYRGKNLNLRLTDWQQFFSIERIKIFINSSVIALGEARVRTFVLTLQRLMDFVNETTATDLLNIEESLENLNIELEELVVENRVDEEEKKDKEKIISKLLLNRGKISKLSSIWLKQINDTYKAIKGDLGTFVERLENLAGNNGTNYVYGLLPLEDEEDIKKLDTVVGENFILKIKTNSGLTYFISEESVGNYVRDKKNATIFTLLDFDDSLEKRDRFIQNIREKFITIGRIETVTVSM